MNIRLKTVVLSLTFLIAMLSVLFSAVASAKEPSAPPYSSQNVSSGYILTEFNGKLSVFESGQNTPITILDVVVETLPERDIESIKKGINCKTFAEAMQRAEDFE